MDYASTGRYPGQENVEQLTDNQNPYIRELQAQNTQRQDDLASVPVGEEAVRNSREEA